MHLHAGTDINLSYIITIILIKFYEIFRCWNIKILERSFHQVDY